MASTASPGAGHATEPKASARPASGSRIKATTPTATSPGDAGVPRPISRRHRSLALSTLEAFEHLSEAQAAVAHLSVHLEGNGAGMDWDSMRATLTDLVAALHLTGSSLAETSSRLTGRQDGSSAHASHVRTLTELLAATSPPELGTAYRDELLAKATSAFDGDD